MAISDLRASAPVRNHEMLDVADALRTVRRLAHFLQKQDPAGRALINMELRNLREVRRG